MGVTWLAYLFAGVMLLTAGYCLSRLIISWREHRRTDQPVDGIHVLMGVAMAGMLVPRLRVFWAGGWEVIFGLATVWFAWLALREYRHRAALGQFRPHHFQHVLGCGAMVYMFAAVTKAAPGAAMSGMGSGAGRFPTLALVLALALFGYVIWTADRLPGIAPVSALAALAPAGPALSTAAPAGAALSALASPASPTTPTSPAPAGSLDGGCGGSAGGASARRFSGPPLSPRLAACCEIAMGVTMGYALILML
jgi:hypothetical protein